MDLQQLIILVVEDDPDARELMQAVLQQRGATVYAAESVQVAFEHFEDQRPDIIVTDIAMPDEDGYALVRRLRSRSIDRGGHTPIIAVSAYTSSSDRPRALAAGFNRYLHKPVDFDELLTAIEMLVRQRDDKAIA